MTDYERYRVLWPDHLGLARGKYLPAQAASRGTSFNVATFALGYDRVTSEVDLGVDWSGFPSIDAEFDLARARPGWEPGTGVIIADLVREGAFFPTAPRTALRRAVADWEALGYRPRIGLEIEGYVLEPDGDGGWRPYSTPSAFAYGTGPLTDPDGLVDEIMMTADGCGIPIESLNTELDYPQFEIAMVDGEALEAVDHLFLLKEMAREIAYRRGLRMTFLGRPFTEKVGSGLHVNVSIESADGGNAFADPNGPDQLSGLARQCIAGLLDHHRGLTALLAPTVNSYRRLVADDLVGVWATWGLDDRCAAVRVLSSRGSTRLEQRTGDGSANPYTAAAAVLQAARLGMIGDAAPPPPGRPEDDAPTVQRCAPDLAGALEDLEADTDLVDAVGQGLVTNFLGVKRAEWSAYLAAGGGTHDVVSPWEVETYLPFI